MNSYEAVVTIIDNTHGYPITKVYRCEYEATHSDLAGFLLGVSEHSVNTEQLKGTKGNQ